MFFTLLPYHSRSHASEAGKTYLISDSWDNLGYKTTYQLVTVSDDGRRNEIGYLNIGKFELGKENTVKVPSSFDKLGDEYFSLGTSVEYYRKLEDIGRGFKQDILTRLRDIALDRQLRLAAIEEDVTVSSLLRDKGRRTLDIQLDRAARNDYAKQQFGLSYQRAHIPGSAAEPPVLEFIVNADSYPPTNVHVLIGRNGVGKSRCLTDLSASFVSAEQGEGSGQIIPEHYPTGNEQLSVSSVITFSFSLFDMPIYKKLEESKKKETLGFFLVGPNIPPEIPPNSSFVKEIEMSLADQFQKALFTCSRNSRMERFGQLMKILENDPLLESYEFSRLPANLDKEAAFEARSKFQGLSSGHKIVCLILAELVAKVAEQTLVIFDEPESHLHPPLLSSLIRAISDLLREQNGLAIIATHSPVVLQEVPKSCVWILNRQGLEISAVRPAIETFGEAVGNLTHDAFGLEARRSGFNSLIESEVKNGLTFEEVRLKFNGQLGSEARSILRSLSYHEK